MIFLIKKIYYACEHFNKFIKATAMKELMVYNVSNVSLCIMDFHPQAVIHAIAIQLVH